MVLHKNKILKLQNCKFLPNCNEEIRPTFLHNQSLHLVFPLTMMWTYSKPEIITLKTDFYQTYLHHRIAYVQSKLLHVRVIIKVRFANQIYDFFFPIRSRSCCCFDHCRCLHIGQLLNAALPGNNVAYFKR